MPLNTRLVMRPFECDAVSYATPFTAVESAQANAATTTALRGDSAEPLADPALGQSSHAAAPASAREAATHGASISCIPMLLHGHDGRRWAVLSAERASPAPAQLLRPERAALRNAQAEAARAVGIMESNGGWNSSSARTRAAAVVAEALVLARRLADEREAKVELVQRAAKSGERHLSARWTRGAAAARHNAERYASIACAPVAVGVDCGGGEASGGGETGRGAALVPVVLLLTAAAAASQERL